MWGRDSGQEHRKEDVRQDNVEDTPRSPWGLDFIPSLAGTIGGSSPNGGVLEVPFYKSHLGWCRGSRGGIKSRGSKSN